MKHMNIFIFEGKKNNIYFEITLNTIMQKPT